MCSRARRRSSFTSVRKGCLLAMASSPSCASTVPGQISTTVQRASTTRSPGGRVVDICPGTVHARPVNVDGRPQRTIRGSADGAAVDVLDQTRLPHEVAFARLETPEQAGRAIRDLVVRGAPLIGVTAAYGMWLAARRDPSDAALRAARDALVATRPTAVNLRGAADAALSTALAVAPGARAPAIRALADRMAEEDVAANAAIGRHGKALLEAAWARKGRA